MHFMSSAYCHVSSPVATLQTVPGMVCRSSQGHSRERPLFSGCTRGRFLARGAESADAWHGAAVDPSGTRSHARLWVPSNGNMATIPDINVFRRRETLPVATAGTRRLGPAAVRRDPVAAAAVANVRDFDAFLRDRFKRDGWDNDGGALDLIVHDRTVPANAAWIGDGMRVGDAGGEFVRSPAQSPQFVAHEMSHGLVWSSAPSLGEGKFEAAVDESMADVMSSVYTRDWKFAEDITATGKPVRDLADPQVRHARELPTTDAAIKAADPHLLAGVPSLAAVRVADKLGLETTGDLWYRAIDDHLDSRARDASSGVGVFAAAARATLDAASQVHGNGSTEFNAVRDAWLSVGVQPRWRPSSRTGPDLD